VLEAHAYNLSYSGDQIRDQEDHGLKPAQVNSSTRPYLKKPFTKIGLVELKVKALSSSPSTANKTKHTWILISFHSCVNVLIMIYSSK
jgi:hypothetical protein